MINNKELAKYLRKEMKTQGEVNTTFHLIKVPTEDDLEFWIQQFKVKDSIGHTEAESNGLLDKKPWVMVAPMMSAKNNFIKHMKTKYDVITIGFSGWANSKKFGFSRGTDYSIPLSDHCDYNELIELVKKSEAEKVYTIHGFVDEFAMDLNKLGFTAQPLREISLDNFC